MKILMNVMLNCVVW